MGAIAMSELESAEVAIRLRSKESSCVCQELRK